MDFSISALISSFFFFLSGSHVTDKNIDRAFYQEQLLQLDTEIHMMLSGEQRYCNCNFQGIEIPESSSVKLDELRYYPDKCSGDSFSMIGGETWKGIPLKGISLGNLQKFSDGYLADLHLEFHGPKSSPATFEKSFPVMLNGEMENGKLRIDCKPVISSVLPHTSGFSVLLNGSRMKYQGVESDVREFVGDKEDEVGPNLPSFRFSSKKILRSFYAGSAGTGQIYCVQLKNKSIECANPLVDYEPFGPASHRLYGVQEKIVTQLVLNHTTAPGLFSSSSIPLFPYEKIGKFITPEQRDNSFSGTSPDLSEINSSPIGDFINRENTFLALYEDGQLSVLSVDKKYHFDIFLPSSVRVKKILTYNFDSACFLSSMDEVYCWGFTAGFYTDGTVKSKLLTTDGPSPESLNVMFSQPVKIPKTKALAHKIRKLDVGALKIKTIKAFYFGEKNLDSPCMCAILSDDKFSCFPRPLDEEGNTWGQMTEFPVLSEKIGGGRVTNFWPWPASADGDDRDPLPIVLVDDSKLIFGLEKSSMKNYNPGNYNGSGIRDVVADGVVVNVLFRDGTVMGLSTQKPKSPANLNSAIQTEDFDLSTESEEARTVFDFGGPVKKIFTNASLPFLSGTLCAWMMNGSIKCSGTRWGYGDGVPRLVTDPETRGEKLPEIKL